MRIRIQLVPEKLPFVLPCNYNKIVQAFIYNHLDRSFAEKIHNNGYKDPEANRKLKLFTFSRLIPDRSPKISKEKGSIAFYGNIYLIVASPVSEFIQSFAENLLKTHQGYLGANAVNVSSVEVDAIPPYRESVLVRTLSPITVYRTNNTGGGRKRTHYYAPFESEWEELLMENLRRKVRICYGRDETDGSIRPVNVSLGNPRIVIYDGTVIKGWDGIFELKLPEKMFFTAFEAGLGVKNSQGFGCIEIFNPSSESRYKIVH